MLTSEEQANVKDLLEVIPLEDLLHVASVVTNKAMPIKTKDDAVKAILLHESSCLAFLNRRKITRGILLSYLSKKEVSCDGAVDKGSLIQRIITYWTGNSDEETDGKTEEPKNQVDSKPESVESILAKQFASWYYEKLNEEFVHKGGEVIEEKDFWPDCQTVITLPDVSEEESQEYISSNAGESVNLLRSLRSQYDLFFAPNLNLDGVQGRIDPHGLVIVTACGTLHSRFKECVGIFNQTFGLIADPMNEGNYKIKKTKLTLRKISPSSQSQQLAILN